MSYEGAFQVDNWHRDAKSLNIRDGVKTRRWGMRVTVYTGPDAGDYVLSYGLSSTSIQDNANWLKVADIGQTWGGGSGGAFWPLSGSATLTSGVTINGGGNSLTLGYLFDPLTALTVYAQNGINLSTQNGGGISFSSSAETANVFIPDNGMTFSGIGDLNLSMGGLLINSDPGTSGYVLTSQGVGLPPVWGPGGGGSVTADNGLTAVGSNVQLGGPLIQSTTIDAAGNDFTLVQSSNITMNSTGGVAGVFTLLSQGSNVGNLTLTSANDTQYVPAVLSLQNNSFADTYSGVLSVGEINPGSPYGYVEIVTDPTIEGRISLLTEDNSGNNAYLNINPSVGILSVAPINASNALVVGTDLFNNESSVILTNGSAAIYAEASINIATGTVFGNGSINLSFGASSDLQIDSNSGTAGDVITSQGAGLPPIWAPAGGGGSVTADNGLTETVNNIQLGGTLLINTTILGGAPPRNLAFGTASDPVASFQAFGTTGIDLRTYSGAGGTMRGQLGLNSFGSMLFATNSSFATNDTSTQIAQTTIDTYAGTVGDGFGGRHNVSIEITGGSGSAFSFEYKAASVASTGAFQYNIACGNVSLNIPDNKQIISVNNPRNVGFFTALTTFGGGSEIIKIFNSSTPASAAVTDSILVWAQDSSDGLSSLAMRTEQAVAAVGANVPDSTLKIRVNGLEYYLFLKAV